MYFKISVAEICKCEDDSNMLDHPEKMWRNYYRYYRRRRGLDNVRWVGNSSNSVLKYLYSVSQIGSDSGNKSD